MTETLYRCPSCKARVELSDTVCSICGESLTPMTLVRTFGSVKQLTRRAPTEAPAYAAVSQAPTGSSEMEDGVETVETARTAAKLPQFMSSATGASQPAPQWRAQPIASPAAAPPSLDAQQWIDSDTAHEPISEPQGALPTPAPAHLPVAANLMSGSSRGWMLLCAVVVLSAALLIGIRLAQETTTPEVRAPVAETSLAATLLPQTAAPIVSNRVNTAPESTVIAQGTEVAESWAAIEARATQRAELTPTDTNTAPSAASPMTATELTQPPMKWQLELASARYETSGRPAQNCSRFKADDPVRKFTFTLKVTNNTGTDLDAKGWGAVAYVGEQPAAQLCYFKTEGPQVPALLQGQTQQVTLSAFVEPNQRISKIVIGDNQGNATRICVNDTRVVNCDVA